MLCAAEELRSTARSGYRCDKRVVHNLLVLCKRVNINIILRTPNSSRRAPHLSSLSRTILLLLYSFLTLAWCSKADWTRLYPHLHSSLTFTTSIPALIASSEFARGFRAILDQRE